MKLIVKVGTKWPDDPYRGWRDGQLIDIRPDEYQEGLMERKHFAIIQTPHDYWELRGSRDWKSTAGKVFDLKKFLVSADSKGRYPWEAGYIEERGKLRDWFIDYKKLLDDKWIEKTDFESIYAKDQNTNHIYIDRDLTSYLVHEDIEPRLDHEYAQQKGSIAQDGAGSGTGGGFTIGAAGDYASVNAFEADIAAQLTGDLTALHLDEETVTTADAVFDTDSNSHLLKLTAEVGAEHDGGVYGNGARVLFGSYDNIEFDETNDGDLDDVEVSNLALDVGSPGNYGLFFEDGANNGLFTANRMLVKGNADNTYNIIVGSAVTNTSIRNCISYGGMKAGGAGIRIYTTNTNHILYNNTCIGNTWGIWQAGTLLGAGSVVVKNNLCQGNTTDYVDAGAGFDTTSKNISEDSTSPDAAYQDVDLHTNSVFEDYDNDDYRLSAAGDNANLRIVDEADDLSGTFTDDIAGSTRSRWFIGASEIIEAPDTGEWVVDSNDPQSIGYAGAAADGAHHIDHDDNVAKLTWDRERIDPSLVIHDPPIQTGLIKTSGFDDSVLFNWDCSDVDDLPTGLTENGTCVNTENGYECTDTNYISMTTAGNLDISQGVIEFWFKSNAAFVDGVDHIIFGCRGASVAIGDFFIRKNDIDYFYITVSDSGGTARYLRFTSDPTGSNWQGWNHFRIIWDSTNPIYSSSYIALYINEIYVTPETDQTSSWTDATIDETIGIGNDYEDTSRDMDGILKNLIIGNDPTVQELYAPRNHVIAHWKMDDNLATTTIVDEGGLYDGTLEGGDNTEDKTQTDAVRGRSLLTDGVVDYLDLSDALAGLTTKDEFTVMITFKPNFLVADGASQILFSLEYDGDNKIYGYYQESTDTIRIFSEINNVQTNTEIASFAGEPDGFFQQWRFLYISINMVNNLLRYKLQGFDPIIFASPDNFTGSFSSFLVGKYSSSFGAYFIDQVKLIDGCLLPYGGGPFTGNGEVDTDVAHEDIVMFLEGDETTGNPIQIAPGSEVVTITGATNETGVDGVVSSAFLIDASFDEISVPQTCIENVAINGGKISFWYKHEDGTPDNSGEFFCFSCFFSSDASTMYFYYGGNSYSDSTAGWNTNPTDGNWHWIEITWIPNDAICFYVDGILEWTESIGVWSSWGTNDFLFGNYHGGGEPIDGYLDQIYITNNPNTPDRWSIFGKPIHYPLLEIT